MLILFGDTFVLPSITGSAGDDVGEAQQDAVDTSDDITSVRIVKLLVAAVTDTERWPFLQNRVTTYRPWSQFLPKGNIWGDGMKFKYISYFGFSLGRWVEVQCKGVFVMCYCKLGTYRVGRLANLAGLPRSQYYQNYLDLRFRFSLRQSCALRFQCIQSSKLCT